MNRADCKTSNLVSLILAIKMIFRVTFRMTLRMTFKTWDFRGVFKEDLRTSRGLQEGV